MFPVSTISQVAVDLLVKLKGNHTEYVFTHRGKPIRQCNTRGWREAREPAGITNFRWYTLRHGRLDVVRDGETLYASCISQYGITC